MKKICFGFFALLLAFSVFAGCDETENIVFKTQKTEQTVLDFHSNTIKDYDFFFDYVNNKNNYNSDRLQSTDRKNATISVNTLQTANANLYTVLPVVDFFTRQNALPVGLYDLSQIGLGNYNIYKANTQTGKVAYLKASTVDLGNLESSPYLPISNIINDVQHNQDYIDDIIEKMGVALKFVYTDDTNEITNIKTHKVVVSTAFYLPTNEYTLASLQTLDPSVQDYAIDTENGTITLVYQSRANSEIYTKVISFSEVTSATPLKKVIKYAGNKITTPESVELGHYFYELSEPENLGTYEIKYIPEKGYLDCKHTQDAEKPGDYTKIETYALQGDIVITRLNKCGTGVKSTVCDFYIAADGISGKIKYLKTSQGLKYINDFTTVTYQTFAVLTVADQTQKDEVTLVTYKNGEVTGESHNA